MLLVVISSLFTLSGLYAYDYQFQIFFLLAFTPFFSRVTSSAFILRRLFHHSLDSIRSLVHTFSTL